MDEWTMHKRAMTASQQGRGINYVTTTTVTAQLSQLLVIIVSHFFALATTMPKRHSVMFATSTLIVRHISTDGAIEVGFMQNFAPNKRGEIAEQRLLYLHRDSDGAGRDGYPYERCWMVLYRLVVQIAVQHYGLNAGVAKLLVMATVAVLNRTVFDGPPTWASNS